MLTTAILFPNSFACRMNLRRNGNKFPSWTPDERTSFPTCILRRRIDLIRRREGRSLWPPRSWPRRPSPWARCPRRRRRRSSWCLRRRKDTMARRMISPIPEINQRSFSWQLYCREPYAILVGNSRWFSQNFMMGYICLYSYKILLRKEIILVISQSMMHVLLEYEFGLPTMVQAV